MRSKPVARKQHPYSEASKTSGQPKSSQVVLLLALKFGLVKFQYGFFFQGTPKTPKMSSRRTKFPEEKFPQETSTLAVEEIYSPFLLRQPIKFGRSGLP